LIPSKRRFSLQYSKKNHNDPRSENADNIRQNWSSRSRAPQSKNVVDFPPQWVCSPLARAVYA
jgi:hypothetical protein